MYSRWTIERAEQEIIRLCHSGLDSRSLRQVVFEKVWRVIPYDAFSCATTDPATLLATSTVTGGFEPEVVSRYISQKVVNELLQEDFNKFTALANSRKPVDTLRIATKGDLTRSRRYREMLEPAGLGHEMRAVLRTGGATWGAVSLHRSKHYEDFTGQQMAFFAAIAPHLATGIRAALLLDAVEGTPITDGPGLLLLAEDLSVMSATPAAVMLLAEINDQPQANALPMAVLAVVARLRALERDGERAGKEIPRVHLRTQAGRWLTLHASRLPQPATEKPIAIIIELATPHAIAPLILQTYGLTPREQEVTALVFKGHSTEDIAAALVISTLTVKQHLKAIFDKVGVRSRRELVAQVFAQSYWPALAASQGVSPAIWSPA